jgi:L-alanine-DL-glutamate epimerase-like enolase superfamily enzyme
MVGVTPTRGPAALASVLESLEVRVESAVVERRAVMLPDYPGGPRPSSVVRLSGGGFSGRGENVAFHEQEQQRFAAHVEHWLRAHATMSTLEVGTALGAGGTAYERAALQAALIDLALRQAGLSLFDLTGVRQASLRFVVSLAANSDLKRAIGRLRLHGYRGDLKVDVDPSWDERTIEMLARESHIAIFDFKGRAEASLARKLYAAFPTALLEDPPPDFEEPELGSRTSRISRDSSLVTELAIARTRARGEAVNLKAPRMGGPLSVLRGLEGALTCPPPRSELASEAGTSLRAYVGGMFEVDVGRIQARQLAALYCASGPNDLALNLTSERARASPRTSPAPIRLDEPGFGTSSIE